MVFSIVLIMAVTGCGAGNGRITSIGAAPTTPPTANPSVSATPQPEPTVPIGLGTWRTLPAAPIPRGFYAGVWTGTEFVLHAPDMTNPDNPIGSIDAAYNPARDTWRRLTSSPYPVRVVEGGPHAVWTGTEILAFGQMDAAYNPATNRWRWLPPGAAGPSITVWTGRQVLMWGGGCCGANSASGSIYDLATNAWQPMPIGPLAGRHTTGAWTGTEMIVVGGVGENGTYFADAAAYNPTTRTWRKLPPLPVPVASHTVTWTGRELLVVGGARRTQTMAEPLATAMAYNPATNTWRRLADMPIARDRHVAVWTGDQLLVWGGEAGPYDSAKQRYPAPAHGVAYDPVTNQWAALPTSPLTARTNPITVWTGTEMIIYGGTGLDPVPEFTDAAAFRPATAATDLD